MSEDDRVDPILVQLQLLSEIKKALGQITVFNESLVEEGIIEPLNPITVTTSRHTVQPPMKTKQWFGVKITNDGPNSAYIILNTETGSNPQELKAGETWGVQFKRAVIKDIMFYTRTGTAVVRIRGER